MPELTTTHVQARLREAIAEERYVHVIAALARIGVGDAQLLAAVAAANERPDTHAPLQRWRARILGAQADPRPFLLERYALLLAALQNVRAVDALPLPRDVVQLLLQELLRLISPSEGELASFAAGTVNFGAICKLVTLRRFPAGQFHWEVSGLERRSLLRVRGLDRLRLAAAILRLGGLSPVLAPHMPWRKQLALLEKQQLLSYFRIAEAMRLQPHIRGMVAESWFHSPDTPRASPHLAWVNRVFGEWGGVVVNSGPAHALSGVYEHGARRRQLAEEGKFTPTLGLVVWPRRAMLNWADHYARNVS